jgi:gliding motility-associated protein GldC
MDLWTKEMPIDEMKSFMLQTFVSMKNSISKATGDENLVNLVDDFCVEFEKRVSEKN